jgi:hypothetical protein
MSSIDSSMSIPTLPLLDDFIVGCVANKLVAHVETLESSLCWTGWGENNEDLYEDETGRELSEHEVKIIQEQEKKKQDEYESIKKDLPEHVVKIVDELTTKYDAVKKIASELSGFQVDKSLYKAIHQHKFEPLEAVESCATYIDNIAQKVEGCAVAMHIRIRTGNCDIKRFFITAADIAPSRNDIILKVAPDTELYVLHNSSLFHLKIKGLDADGKGKMVPLRSSENGTYMDPEQLLKLQAQFNAGEPSKNTILICQYSRHELIQIPAAIKISSLIKPSNLAFEQVQEFFAEGTEARSILPKSIVNTILKDYCCSS